MKRLIFIAALVLSALTLRAQGGNGYNTSPVPSDSVSVMLRHIQNTNAEIVRLNKAYTMHSVMVSAGGALVCGGLLMATRKGNVNGIEMMTERKVRTGLQIASVGAAIIVASVLAMPKGVRLDERGLVVDLP